MGGRKTEMKSNLVLHMLIIYLGGFTSSTRENDTCGEGITGEACTISEPSGAGTQQIVFSDPSVVFPCSTGTCMRHRREAEQFKLCNKPC